jgi:hypothetical protein
MLPGVLRLRSIPFWQWLGKLTHGLDNAGIRNFICLGIYSALPASHRASIERIMVSAMRGLSRAYCHDGFSNYSTRNRTNSQIVRNTWHLSPPPSYQVRWRIYRIVGSSMASQFGARGTPRIFGRSPGISPTREIIGCPSPIGPTS